MNFMLGMNVQMNQSDYLKWTAIPMQMKIISRYKVFVTSNQYGAFVKLIYVHTHGWDEVNFIYDAIHLRDTPMQPVHFPNYDYLVFFNDHY